MMFIKSCSIPLKPPLISRCLCTTKSPITSLPKGEALERARTLLQPLGQGDVVLEKDEKTSIATISLRHESKKNALSGRMMVQLADIVGDLEGWTSGRGLILRAEGDFFCSGGDLTTISSIGTHDGGYLMCTLMQDTTTRLSLLPLVSVSLVQGRALGGGAELMTSSDFRIFTQRGQAAFVQGVMGLSPGWGGGSRLVRVLGYQKALDLLVSGRKVDAPGALQIGLADDVLEEERLQEWLAQRIKFDPQVIRAMKRIAAEATARPLTESLEIEKSLFYPLFSGPANVNAMKGNIKH